MADGGAQSAYALVAAAFVTGIWAWIAQKTKEKGSDETKLTTAEFSDRQSLVEEYRKSNEQLQARINVFHEQIDKLWTTIREMQRAIEECEKGRIEDLRLKRELQTALEECQYNRREDLKKIVELERKTRMGGIL